ncbi:hypothetical protein BDZ89DRAFT_1125876 [Hymenopellis radicata]|nr:hypothetical protein BDZ89DRAFT_1125876 [Hymenopellis radicata]
MFCHERNIPVLHRVLAPPPLHPGLDIASFLQHRSPGGYVNRIESIPFLDYDLKSTYTLQPAAHWAVGALEEEGYIRTTSPLRRYLDLMSHWQIHASLRGEKSVYSKDDLLVKAELTSVTDRWYRREDGRNNVMWQMMFLERWINQPSKDVPNPLENLEALVMDVPTHHPRRMNFVAPVHLPELGIRGTVVNLNTLSDVEFGQTIKVKNLRLNKGYHASLWLDLAE